MSFADELRSMNPADKDAKEHSQYVERRSQECLYAIKNGCREKQLKGQHVLSGEFYFDDSDYGTYVICEHGTYNSWATISDMEQLKANVEKGLSALGFTNCRVEVRQGFRIEEKYNPGALFHSYKKIKHTAHALYIYIAW